MEEEIDYTLYYDSNSNCVSVALGMSFFVYSISVFITRIYDKQGRRNKLNYLPYYLFIFLTFCFTLNYVLNMYAMSINVYESWIIGLGWLGNAVLNAFYLFYFYLFTKDILIVNLLLFQSRCTLEEFEFKKDQHFRREIVILAIMTTLGLSELVISITLNFMIS